MKKILGISLVAVLAVTPLMARAETAPSAYALTQYNATTNDTGEAGLAKDTETGTTPVATGTKYFKGKSVSTTDAEIVATGAYVKGAYNAAISAINAVAEDADSKIAGITLHDGEGIDIDESNNINVNLTQNKGLQVDAQTHTLEIKDGAGIKTGSNGVEVDLTSNGGLDTDNNGQLHVVVDNTTVELNQSGQLQVKNAGTYATKTGVVDTIESSSVNGVSAVSLTNNGAVSAYTDWSSESTASLGGASLSVTTSYMPVVVTATESVANSGTYDVKYRDGSTQQPAATGTQPSTTPAP